ncbi:MAG: efflux RND transporter periplasmic adaptor subunit [Woeseiaceae bacterium]
MAAIYTLSGCEDNSSTINPTNSKQPHDVAVSKIEEQIMPVILPVPGTVISKERLKVSSRITGFIEKINVDEGDIVKPGDALVEIDNAQVEAAIKGADATVLAAKADLLDAEGDIKRVEKLVQSKTVAEDDLRNAEVRQAKAKAALAIAEAQAIAKRQERRYSHITSPVHAQVRERLNDPGDLATAGESILQLDVLGAMELEIYLPSTSIDNIAIGQTVNVQIETFNELLSSQITSIVRSADNVTRRYKIRLLLPADKKLTPGQFGTAQFVLREEATLLIPVSAITERAGIEGVFIKDASNKLRFRSIRLGKKWKDFREVLAGLKINTFVVTHPTVILRDGDMIR